MYCPKCKAEVGNEVFCENCGTETMDKLGSNRTEDYKNQEKDFKANAPSMPKINLKTIIKLGVASIVIIALIFSYTRLNNMYSADSTVEKYISLLTEGKAKQAFNMLDIEEDGFINSEQFEQYIDSLGVEGKESHIRTSENMNKAYSAFSNEKKESTNIDPRDMKFFVAQIESETYPMTVIRTGKKLGIFDNWVIGSDGLTTEWKIQAPKGTKMYIEGEEVKQIDDVPTIGGFDALFVPENKYYTINSIFPNDYTISATLEGGKDIEVVASPKDKTTTLNFEASEELVTELTNVTEKFIKLYYAEADESDYTDIIHNDANLHSRLNNSFRIYDNKEFKQMEIIEGSLYDLSHAKLSVTVTFDYERESYTNWFSSEKTIEKGSETEVFDLSFKKVGEKWLIVDTGYLY